MSWLLLDISTGNCGTSGESTDTQVCVWGGGGEGGGGEDSSLARA